MHRRRVLSAMTVAPFAAVDGSWLVGLLDAPLSSGGAPPAVRVEHRRYGGPETGRYRDAELTVERGEVRLEVDGAGGSHSSTRDVDPTRYERTRRLVTGATPADWRDTYTDPAVATYSSQYSELAVEIDGRRFETRVETPAPPLPEDLRRLQTHVDTYWESFPERLGEADDG